jgi:hypothetical protein
MKHSEVLNRYVNTGSPITEKQYDRLSSSLQKSYKRIREIAGYSDWEFKILSDDEKIKYIETQGENLNNNYINHIIYYSFNKDSVATKIIEIKGEKLSHGKIAALMKDSEDADDIATKIIEKKAGLLNDDDKLIPIITYYAKNKDNIIIKIIQSKNMVIDQFNMVDLLKYSIDKELIKKTLLQNGVNYELINKVIRDNYLDTPPILHNNPLVLNEIRRIKEIMK